jgi:toxin YoeB
MVKYKIEWSIEARLDLLDILNFYIFRNKSTVYSKKLKLKVNGSTKLIKKNPFIGLQTQIVSVRAFVSGDYQIIYELIDDVILILMVWDCRRDPEDKILETRVKIKH